MANLAMKVQTIRHTPKESWKAVKEIQKGVTGHYTQPTIMQFKIFDGATSQKNIEHISIMHAPKKGF